MQEEQNILETLKEPPLQLTQPSKEAYKTPHVTVQGKLERLTLSDGYGTGPGGGGSGV